MTILHLEDNDLDAELIAAAIHREWPACQITRVTSRECYEEAVSGGDFDIILSDHQIPGFSGIAALDIAREKRPHIPFIFLSGTIGEARAIEALRHGAADYVMKGARARLVPAISAALEKRAAQEELLRSHERLHEQASLIDKARDGICLFDLEGMITLWNESAARIYGRTADEMIGTKFPDSVFRGSEAQFRTAFALTVAAGEWHGEFQLTTIHQRPLIIESTWSLIHDLEGRAYAILCIDTDVTERKEREREWHRTQRLESLGMLAGGIAHDLNNTMSPVMMSAGLLRLSLKDPADLSLVETIEQSAANGAELVRQILLFARGGEGERTDVHLGELLGQMIPFLKATLRRAIDLQLETERGLWLISADATQIKQIVLNLCVNARDASPKGTVAHLKACNTTVAPGGGHGFRGEIAAGRYVQLSVSDGGTGIPEEILEKIFDPFFTTKEAGKGTGMGLATTLGIVQAHDGHIQVETEVGRGTAFHIYFPALDER